MLDYIKKHAQKLYMVKIGDDYFIKAILTGATSKSKRAKRVDIILVGLESVSQKYQFISGEIHLALSKEDLSPQEIISLDRIIPEEIEDFCFGENYQVDLINPGYRELINISHMLQEKSIIGDQMGIYFSRAMEAVKYFPLATKRTSMVDIESRKAGKLLDYLFKEKRKRIKRLKIGQIRSHTHLTGIVRINDNYIISMIPRSNHFESDSKYMMIHLLSGLRDQISKKKLRSVSLSEENLQEIGRVFTFKMLIRENRNILHDHLNEAIVAFDHQTDQIKLELYNSIGLSRLLASKWNSFLTEDLFLAYYNGKIRKGDGVLKEAYSGHYRPVINQTQAHMIVNIPGLTMLYIKETQLTMLYNLRTLFRSVKTRNPGGYWTKILREAISGL